jgi:hypothetical protein
VVIEERALHEAEGRSWVRHGLCMCDAAEDPRCKHHEICPTPENGARFISHTVETILG